jgi:hypothetical protein
MENIKYELIDLQGQHKWFTHIKVSVDYRKNGVRLDGERGYYLFCTPVRRHSDTTYTTESTVSGDGIYILLSKCCRFNKRHAEHIAKECNIEQLKNKDSWFFKVVDYICRKHKLHIGECALKEGEFCVR